MTAREEMAPEESTYIRNATHNITRDKVMRSRAPQAPAWEGEKQRKQVRKLGAAMLGLIRSRCMPQSDDRGGGMAHKAA